MTPDTILAWHRKLIAAKWSYPQKRVGRPGVVQEIRELIVRMAEQNPSWGYARIQGALKHLDHHVARSTIAKVLKEHGIQPSPNRPMSRTFVRSHATVIAAADFFITTAGDDRSVDRSRASQALHAVRGRHRHASRPHRRDNDNPDVRVDGASRSEPD